MLYAIIVAGGKGLRAGGGIPKQFRELCGRPLLWWSLRSFYMADPEIHLVVVLPEGFADKWRVMMEALPKEERIPHKVVVGGASRTESVFNGLGALGDSDGLVAVHDGARPMVSPELILRGFAAAAASGAAVPVVPLTDSIRRLTPDGSEVADRSQFVAVQTPQVFDLSLLRRCYSRLATTRSYTDDASVVEPHHTITLFDGDPRNLKVTNPSDFAIADGLLGG